MGGIPRIFRSGASPRRSGPSLAAAVPETPNRAAVAPRFRDRSRALHDRPRRAMTARTLPAEVYALIRGPLETMAHVEALLLLHRSAPDAASVAAVAAEAQIPT